ncbi:unnamed protein product [Phytophthora fragariaefolia]|uniref:Unnamed protein product n=1 Tax=Phytophthora fragariaefolia TaxID=1490495 RepID=A0A9W6WTS8_9STRA|nr:unnamed protein product [Phytophthora fragariaefolia]
MAADIAHFVRDETGLSVYTGSTNTRVSNSARVLCAAALQYLSTTIDLVTGFSIALNTSTLHGKSYLDVRVRFSLKGALYNFHMMAIPLYQEHIGENTFASLSSFLDALAPEWRQLLVGVSTDGDSSMTGRIRGVATRLEASVPTTKLVRVWCALHQLDLVMQRVHKSSLDEEFLSTVASMTGHLRRQSILVMKIGSTCPLCIPSMRWWGFVSAVHVLATEANIVFVKLQRKLTLISQQQGPLANLVATHARLTGMEGPVSSNDLKKIDNSRSEVCSAYALSHACARKFMFETDSWVKDMLACATEEDEAQLPYAEVGKMFVQAADRVSGIVAGLGLSDVEVHVIVQQLSLLRRAYAYDNILRLALDTLDDETTTFDERWGTVGEGYDLVKQFCGDLASTFPNTATVESDFLVLGWEKDEYRRSITDFSLEDVMHYKQFKAFRELVERLIA